MAEIKEKRGWNPYLAGALSGVLLVLSFGFTGKLFGASTSFVRSVGMIESLFMPIRTFQMEYFIKESPKIDWQWMFVLGILLGSFLSSTTTRTFRIQDLPAMWQARFGPSRLKRAMFAFLGGIVAMFGARLADGCTSGHGLSGMAQLSASSLLVFVGIAIGGILMAHLLYGRRSKQ